MYNTMQQDMTYQIFSQHVAIAQLRLRESQLLLYSVEQRIQTLRSIIEGYPEQSRRLSDRYLENPTDPQINIALDSANKILHNAQVAIELEAEREIQMLSRVRAGQDVLATAQANLNSHIRQSRMRREGQQSGWQHARYGEQSDPSDDSSIPKTTQTGTAQMPQDSYLDAVQRWRDYTLTCFEDYSQMQQFPDPPGTRYCYEPRCWTEKRALEACSCDIRRAFVTVTDLDLKLERHRWHPDKFSACSEEVRDDFWKKAEEVFVVLNEMHEMGKE